MGEKVWPHPKSFPHREGLCEDCGGDDVVDFYVAVLAYPAAAGCIKKRWSMPIVEDLP